MGPLDIVEAKVSVEPSLGLPSVRVGPQVELFVLHRAPEPLHPDCIGVSVPPFSAHAEGPVFIGADSDSVPLQEPGEGLSGELAAPSAGSGQAMVGVEDVWLVLAQRLFQGLDTKVSIQGVGSRFHRGQATTYRSRLCRDT